MNGMPDLATAAHRFAAFLAKGDRGYKVDSGRSWKAEGFEFGEQGLGVGVQLHRRENVAILRASVKTSNSAVRLFYGLALQYTLLSR